MKIAIVKLSALGDIIHAMTVLQFIQASYPKIEIDWIVEESYKELLDFHPTISKVHLVSIKKAKGNRSILMLAKELWRVRGFGQYDMVIDMQGLIKSAIISRFIRSPLTIGFDRHSAREGIASFFYHKKFKYDYGSNVVERNFELVKFALGLNCSNQKLLSKSSFLYSSKKYVINQISSSKKNIILIPGASHFSKRYPPKKLAELANLLDANFIVIWGGKDEKKLAYEVQSFAPKVNISTKLSLEILISLISQVDLVIGPDTGPTHIAWALNIPSITIFGPTPGYRNTLVTVKNKIIESKSYVDPLNINKSDYSIGEIKVKEILKLAKILLDKQTTN